MSRIICRLLGHAWVPAAKGWEVCSRNACRGRANAIRRAPWHA